MADHSISIDEHTPIHIGDNTEFTLLLTEQLADLLPSVIKEICEVSLRNESDKYDSVSEIIRRHANKNITVGLDSPSDLFEEKTWSNSAIADIALIICNHVRMLFNIGKAFGKEDAVLGLELLVSILLEATDISETSGLLRMADGRTQFHPPDEVTFRALLFRYAGIVFRKLEKARIAKFHPRVVPLVIGAWGTFSADEIGRRGIEFLSRELIICSGDNKPCNFSGKEIQPSLEADVSCDIEKVKVLINLLKYDHVPEDRKTAVLELFIDDLHLDVIEKQRMRRKVADVKLIHADLLIFQKHDSRKIDLMIDVLGLAFFDYKITPARIFFVKNIGKEIGFSVEELDNLIDEEVRILAFNSRHYSYTSR
ncbi:MAG: hypothetical protein HQM09_17165 [Candidatus Riflebacteria bacterium]|nr:hypothetical protein [Candidatus Riflebacteria bacterium]